MQMFVKMLVSKRIDYRKKMPDNQKDELQAITKGEYAMKRTSPIRVGVIGLGAIGTGILKAFTDHPETVVVAVCDASEERAREVAQKENVAAWYTDYKVLLTDESIALVYVATPPKLHHRIVLDVLAAGKHILCEKPLANSLKEAEEMLEAAQQAGVVHAMNFPLNYAPELKKFTSLVREGYLGKLRRIELTMNFPTWPRRWQQNGWIGGREQGGFVREVGPHLIQVVQRVFGKMIDVKSELELPENPQACETGIIASMKLADGTPVTISGLSQVAAQERVEVKAYGTEGTISLLNWGELHIGRSNEPLAKIELAAETPFPGQLLQNIVQAIDGEEADLYDFQVGYDVQILLESLL